MELHGSFCMIQLKVCGCNLCYPLQNKLNRMYSNVLGNECVFEENSENHNVKCNSMKSKSSKTILYGAYNFIIHTITFYTFSNTTKFSSGISNPLHKSMKFTVVSRLSLFSQ